MTDERAQPRNFNESHEPKRLAYEQGSDRSRVRERNERQQDGRSTGSRYEDQGEYGSGDASQYSSQGLYGRGEHGRSENGQGLFGQGPYTGQQQQYGNPGSYRSSRPEGRDQGRGNSRSSTSQPFSYGAERDTEFSASRSQGPYAGKGPKGYKRSDQQMCEEANQALERNGRVDASEIEVSCDSGVLKLTGKVENRAAKRDAEECVESVYGVSDVMNELKVENGFFANLFGNGSNAEHNVNKSSDKSTHKDI